MRHKPLYPDDRGYCGPPFVQNVAPGFESRSPDPGAWACRAGETSAAASSISPLTSIKVSWRSESRKPAGGVSGARFSGTIKTMRADRYVLSCG